MRKNTVKKAAAAGAAAPKQSEARSGTGAPKQSEATVRRSGSTQGSMLDAIEAWLQQHRKPVFWTIFSLSVLFGLLLFDVKISEGNDDALYIEGGYNYAQDFTGYYFTANAPLYPMLLGVVIKMVGYKLMVLKLLNLIFFISSIVVLYYAFRNRVPYSVLFPVLLFTAINSYYLYFSTFTYTESLFNLLQSSFLLIFFTSFDYFKDNSDLKKMIPKWLLIGFSIFLLTFCKNIAIGVVGVLVLYFLLERRWLFAVLSVASYLIIRFPFEFLRGVIWGSKGQYESQTQILLQKDPYDITKGYEDFSGFITRFLENTNLFISKRFFQILGFRSEDITTTKPILVFLFICLLILSAVYIIKNKQKYLGFVLLYSVCLMSLTFLVLQVRWDQPRFVLVFTNLILFAVFYGFYSFQQNKGNFRGVLYLTLVSIVLLASLKATIVKAVNNYPKLKKNLSGDLYYGYSEDWKNYLKLSEWCGENLPSGSLVACRKAPMSFVYGKGMKFYPVYSVLAIDSSTSQSNPDSLLALFKKDQVTHVILASLRRNPKKLDGYVINTLHRMMNPIAMKYPEKLKLVRTEGVSEPAYLYKIEY